MTNPDDIRKKLAAGERYDPWWTYVEPLQKTRSPYVGLDELRAKLTSWPALLFKRYEVARALALGWWHQNTPYEKGCIKDMLIASLVCGLLLGLLAWIASRCGK